MKRYVLPLLILLFAAIGGSAGFLLGGYLYDDPPPPTDIEPVEIGEIVPDFELADNIGVKHRLSRWRGKLLIVNYWASWCPPCIEEMPLLDRYAKARADRNVAVIGIAEDDPATVRSYLATHSVDYPILLGGMGTAGNSALLGNIRNVLPYTVLIGRDGRLLARHAGLVTEVLLDQWLAEYREETF